MSGFSIGGAALGSPEGTSLPFPPFALRDRAWRASAVFDKTARFIIITEPEE